jgi:hypothetical protein
LARFHADSICVNLVLFSWAPNSGDQDQFHPEALDGNHATMRANYLHAVHDFVSHLAVNSTAAAPHPLSSYVIVPARAIGTPPRGCRKRQRRLPEGHMKSK